MTSNGLGCLRQHRRHARNQQPQHVPTRQLEVADGNRDPLLERNRVFAAAGAYAGLSILSSQPAGSRPRVSYPASSVAAAGHEPQRETMRHGCQDTARADTAGWERGAV